MSIDYGGGWNQVEMRRTNRRRTCDWCFDAIFPGDPYGRYWGDNGDGDANSVECHPDCWEAVGREEAEMHPLHDLVSWGERHMFGRTLTETEAAR